MADWFEEAARRGAEPKAASNWMMGELTRRLNEEGRGFEDCPLRPEQLAGMLALIDKGTISTKIAKTVFEEMYRTGGDAGSIVKEKGLTQISDEGAILKAVEETLSNNPEEVERYRAGDEKLMGFFVGQVMKLTKGKANPRAVNEAIRKKLSPP
jgi:aspartyl-tRNA(Asn)/glutamyl-tRNA(Gln) amidotransferase subunit B